MAAMGAAGRDIKTWPKYAHTTQELIRFIHEDSNGNPYHSITLTCTYGEEAGQWIGQCVELGTATFADTFDQMRVELREAVELQLTEVARLSSVQDYLDYLAEHEVTVVPMDDPNDTGIIIADGGQIEHIGT